MPCQFGSMDVSKGQETIRPEDLIPVAGIKAYGETEALDVGT